jgi:hypothetical protein
LGREREPAGIRGVIRPSLISDSSVQAGRMATEVRVTHRKFYQVFPSPFFPLVLPPPPLLRTAAAIPGPPRHVPRLQHRAIRAKAMPITTARQGRSAQLRHLALAVLHPDGRSERTLTGLPINLGLISGQESGGVYSSPVARSELIQRCGDKMPIRNAHLALPSLRRLLAGAN